MTLGEALDRRYDHSRTSERVKSARTIAAYKFFLESGRIAGVRFGGDISGARLLRSLMLRGEDVPQFSGRLVEPGFSEADLVPPLLSL